MRRGSTIFQRAIIALVLGLLLPPHADAFMRRPMWDDELVDQTDLIVVAHLKENRFESAKDPQVPEYDRKVYFITLVVSRVLKGEGSPGDLRVGLHDPNYPTVLGGGGPMVIVPPPVDEHTAASAAIGVAAMVGTIMVTTTEDIRQDQIWFLRLHPPSYLRTADSAGPPGLWFPEGVQPVKLVPYYQAVMKGDAKAVAGYDDQKGDWWSHRVQFASENIAAKKALLEHDPSARCDELIKIYTKNGAYTPAGTLALKEIMACGDLGASKLIPLFVNADDHTLDRAPILRAWQEANYKAAAPFILFWLRGELDWWNKNYQITDRRFATHEGPKGGEAYNDPRSVSYRNIASSVGTLAALHFLEAVTVIEQIRTNWISAGPYEEGNDPVKTCDDALNDLK